MQGIWQIVLFSPAIVAACWAIYSKAKQRQWFNMCSVIGMVALFSFNLGYSTLFVLGKPIPTWLSWCDTFMLAIFIPILFGYVTSASGSKPSSWWVWAMGIVALLIFLPDLNLHLGGHETPDEMPNIVSRGACLNIFSHGKLVFTTAIINLVNMAQLLMITGYLPSTYIKLKKYELQLSKEARFLLLWWLLGFVFLVGLVFIPLRVWTSPFFLGPYFIVYMVLVTGLMIQIARNYDVHPLLSKQGEEVMMAAFIDKHRELAAQMRFVMDQERMYLQPGLSIDSVADHLGSNRSYLARVMKAEFGMTFSEYVAKKRIEYAKELMLSTSRLLEDIARESGFNDGTTFGRAFKRLVGETPDRWRRANKGIEK